MCNDAVYIGRGNGVIARNNKTRKSFTRFYLVSTASTDDTLQPHLTLPAPVSCHSRSCLTMSHGPSSHVGIGRATPHTLLPPLQKVILSNNKLVIVQRCPSKNYSRAVIQVHRPSGMSAVTLVQKTRTESFDLKRRSMLRLPKAPFHV
jgi:hypothetical protein